MTGLDVARGHGSLLCEGRQGYFAAFHRLGQLALRHQAVVVERRFQLHLPVGKVVLRFDLPPLDIALGGFASHQPCYQRSRVHIVAHLHGKSFHPAVDGRDNALGVRGVGDDGARKREGGAGSGCS